MRDRYGRNTFGQSCLLARRLVEAGTRVVEVIWPKVANSDNHSWDHHVGSDQAHEDQSGPMLDTGSGRASSRTWISAACSRKRWSSPSANSAAARKRASAPPATATAPTAAITGLIATPAIIAGAGIKRGYVHGKSDKTGSQPGRRPGASDRNARHDLSRLRHRSGNDRLQPPQPAARVGESESRDEVVRLTESSVRRRLAFCPLRFSSPAVFAGALWDVAQFARLT